MQKIKKEELFTIPNIMGYFRIILIPVYLILYYKAHSTSDYYTAAAIIALSGLTDLFDGKIARKFNMVTDLGKMLDPLADKLTLGCLALSFTFRYPFMRELLILFAIKELYMLLMGILFMSKGWKTKGATGYGKLCTASLYIIMFLLLLFPELKIMTVNILILTACIIMLITLTSYIEFYTRLFKEIFIKNELPDKADSAITEHLIKIRRRRRHIFIPIFIIIVICYLGIGAVVPFIKQKEISSAFMSDLNTESFYSDTIGVDRARIIEDNGEALDERIRLIASAKERIILSTFDFRSDESGLDMLAALLDAANRGVGIQIFVDGFNSWTNMEGNAYFYALSSLPNVKIIVYNKINLFMPWTIMGRMHDKYLITDSSAYILGGRNTFGYFLGNYPGHKNYDRDVLVYNTDSYTDASSLYQVEAYFNSITSQSCCSLFHDSPSNAKRYSVKKATDELTERYNKIKAERPDLFEDYNYAANTFETDKITLLSNPTGIYSKEPTVFYTLTALMKSSDSVKIHTPYIICNDDMYREFTEVAACTDTTIMFNSSPNNGNYFAASDYHYHKDDVVSTGMRILEYQGGVSYHGKSIAFDDTLSAIGSFNMDMRSAYIDTELMLVIDSVEINSALRTNMEEYEKSALINDKNGNYDSSSGMIQKEYSRKKLFKIRLFHLLDKIRILM